MTNHVISTVYYFMCVMLTSDVNCLFTPRSEENNGKKTEIIDQPRFHADMQNTSQKCPLISSLTPLFDSTNYLALFRSYQRAMIHCQTFSVARGERNAHFSVLAPRLCPEYAVIFLYSPGGFYPFFIKPKQRLLLVAFRRRRRKNKYR